MAKRGLTARTESKLAELSLEVAQGKICKRGRRYSLMLEGKQAIGMGIAINREHLAKLVNLEVIAVISNTQPRMVVAIAATI